jgi:hypothetical protein
VCKKLIVFCLLAVCAFAQSDRGTITGAVTDPSNAAVVNATVVATNLATNAAVQVRTTETGNYTIPQLPAGTYSITVEQSGFRKFEQRGITIQVAQTARVDIRLQVGSTSESVTVTADAALLKTDSAEQSVVLGAEAINSLPLNFANLNTMRNPLTFVSLAPGTTTGAWNTIRVNGAPENTHRISFEGQDATNAMNPRVFDEMSPSVDAVQEFAVQSSNFSAEFGQVGGGLFNFTARSGTAQFHGTLYDYFVNEAMNAGSPWSTNGDPVNPKKLKTKQRQMDFGGSLGGPLVIPRIYNGKEKGTFFFFNYEIFRNIETRYLGMSSLPTMLQRQGNFSQTLTTRVLPVKDPLGRDLIDGMIFDPATVRMVNGVPVRDPFSGNIVPQSSFDPISSKVQSLIPAIKSQYQSLLSNNFAGFDKFDRIQHAPSIKVDQNIGSKGHISGYYGLQRVDLFVGGTGLPDPLNPLRQLFIRTHTFRVNYDHTLTPTMLLHVGVGYQRYINPDTAVPIQDTYNAEKELGLKGALRNGFPRITGIPSSNGFGPTNIGKYLTDKPTAAMSLTWVRSNHTFKFGGDFKIDAFTNIAASQSVGVYAFSATETTQPSTQGQNLGGGTLGNAYASFLLGSVGTGTIANASMPQYRRQGFAFFGQDTWKVTSKLTLDLGLRWDIEVPPHELHHRMSMFSFDTPNPSAGGILGAAIYEGNGPGRCNCNFTHAYMYAFGPRVGVAYRLDNKTVLRGGIGFSYAGGAQYNYLGAGNSLGFEWNSKSWTAPSYGEAALQFKNGLSYNLSDLYTPSLSAGIRPVAGRVDQNLPAYVDRNAGRPGRQLNWSFGLQRELTRDLVVEAAYVGNRGVWWQANALVNYNALTPARLASFGLDINSAADRALLGSRVDSSAAVARGIKAPYAGFPTSQTVAQALRPYPQFTAVNTLWAPLGNTWYDSLQLKINKRMSNGLMITGAYTWSKNLGTVDGDTGSSTTVNDVFNRATVKSYTANDYPHIFTLGANYDLPLLKVAGSNRILRKAAEGWQLGGMVRYSSGQLIRVPTANNNLTNVLNRSTFANRVAGQPLFLKNPNDGIDVNKELALNPAAWVNPPEGQFGTSAAYYSDYRWQRRPSEQASLAKITKIREGMTLEIRAQFFNIFNRLNFLPMPSSTNFQATTVRDANGVLSAGFGYISVSSIAAGQDRKLIDLPFPRTGQIIARLRF